MDEPTDDEYRVAEALSPLVDGLWVRGMLVRLVGVAATGFDDDAQPMQDTLFDVPAAGDAARADSNAAARHAGLIAATDRIRDRFGERAVNFGRENATLGSTTGSSPKNPEDYKGL